MGSCSINRVMFSGVRFLAISLFFMVLAGNFSAFSQVKITRKIPSQDSLVRLVGRDNIDTTYSFRWQEDSNRWETHKRNLHFYNDQQKLLTLIHQDWKDGEWVNAERSIKSYDDKGKLIETLDQEWNRNLKDWVNLQLRTITYDRWGQKSEILYQQWRKALGEWFSTVRYLIEYNRNGEESNVLIKTYSPEEDAWYNHQRYLFYYEDGFGHPDEVLVEQWDKKQRDWRKRGKYWLSHNYRGMKTLEIQATWNEYNNDWMKGLKYEYEYDKNLLIQKTEYRWDFKDKSWNNALRKEMRYNEEEEVQEEFVYRWNKEEKQWILVDHFFYDIEKPDVNPANLANRKD
jgi:hypothetical protein